MRFEELTILHNPQEGKIFWFDNESQLAYLYINDIGYPVPKACRRFGKMFNQMWILRLTIARQLIFQLQKMITIITSEQKHL